MAQGLPAWIDDCFLTSVLEGGKTEGPKVTIVSFSGKSAISAGDSFCSYIYRVKVIYRIEGSTEEKSDSLIVKQPIKGGFVYDLVKNTDFFDKEPIFYGSLLKEMNAKLNCEFSPTSFYSPIEHVIVQRDIAPDYYTGDRIKQLSFAHAKLVFTTLAKFHASAIAVHHENPKLIESVKGETLYLAGSPLQRWIELATKTIGEVLSEIEGCKEYADFFLSKVDTIWESGIDVVKDKYRINCQLHGDSWTNNLMFKYNSDKEPVDVKLIDYQLSRYTTPVLDLIYFLYTSANYDARERQRELLDIYLKTFNSSLEQLGCQERMTFEQLKDDVKAAIPFFIMCISFALTPMIAVGTSDGESFEEFSGEDVRSGRANPIIMKMCHGQKLRSLLPDVMRQFVGFISS